MATKEIKKENIKSFDRAEIRSCDSCGNPIGITPYRIRLEQHIVDPQKAQQAMGMEMFFGGGVQGAVLGSIMGSQTDFTIPLGGFEGVICQECATTRPAFAIGTEPEETVPA